MKAAKVTLIVIIVSTLIAFVHRGYHFGLVDVLPFCSDCPPDKYDVVGAAMIVVAAAAAHTLVRQPRDG